MKSTAYIFLSVIVLAGCNGPSSSVNRKPMVPQTTTNNLAKHKGMIQQYIEAVDTALLTELPKGKIDRMTRAPWQDEMPKQFQNGDPTSVGITLWSETRPIDNFIQLRIQCNISVLKQMPFATIAPSLSIPLPERNMRLDWYISTGNKSLDRRFTAIAEEKAKTFQQKVTIYQSGRAHFGK